MKTEQAEINSKQAAALHIIMVISEAIREMGSVPAGHLYAQSMNYLSLEGFDAVINVLVGAGVVRREPTHLLVWIGPKKEGGK